LALEHQNGWIDEFSNHGPETFEKCSILVKVKEGENFNQRNMLNISRIEI